MIMLSELAGALLQALPDTIVTKQVVEEPGWLGRVTSISSGLVSIALLVLTAFLVPAAWNVRKSHQRVKEMLDKVYADILPIMHHASSIADNVDYITTSVRVDIQQVSQTIASANERLTDALAVSERRVKEFNALLRVVQDEAEQTFVSTAATLRGVRAGAAAFGDEAAGLILDDDLDDEEIYDGYDSSHEAGQRERNRHESTGPRIRPRTRPDGAT
ncbi:MAG: DUF948 domain-containing protein [Gemmatimonadaceae bacterium]